MASNDRIILDEVLKQRQQEVDPKSKASDFFELFTAEQILKDFDLSYDEIESGLVGSGGDGGIDSIFLFVNGDLAHEGLDYDLLKKNIALELVIIQSKMTAGFRETPVERFITVTEDILDLAKDASELASVYNPPLVEAIKRFREVQQRLASRFPALRIYYHYATKGASPDVNVSRKVEVPVYRPRLTR